MAERPDVVARQQILDEMGDGFVVLDTDGRVVDSNPIARAIAGSTPAVREALDASAAAAPDPMDEALDALHGRAVTATVDGRQRTYDVQRSSLSDHPGRLVGDVLAFRDVTERNAHEQRLEVTQRLLRHNRRNKMNVVRGWAELVDEATPDGQTEAPRRMIAPATSCSTSPTRPGRWWRRASTSPPIRCRRTYGTASCRSSTTCRGPIRT